jgi:hypothetical protein
MFLWSHNNDTVQYSGWTECSASPNAEKNNMIDAIVIELPFSEQRDGKNNSDLEDLEVDMLLDLKETLQGYAHLNFTVLLLKQTREMKERECVLLWEGKACDEGYSKEFVSVEFIINDGSCLAKAKGEDVVRFHDSNSGYCPQVPINKGEGEHPMTEEIHLPHNLNVLFFAF